MSDKCQMNLNQKTLTNPYILYIYTTSYIYMSDKYIYTLYGVRGYISYQNKTNLRVSDIIKK